MRKRAMTVMTGALLTGAMLTGLAAPATAAPATVLPDADLVCGTTVLEKDDWAALGPAPTVWITSGPLAGHYVVLESGHFVLSGLRSTASVLADFPAVATKEFGQKTGLDDEDVLSCRFVSRLSQFGVTVVGPMTIARVS